MMLNRRHIALVFMALFGTATWLGLSNAQQSGVATAPVQDHGPTLMRCAEACSTCQRHCDSCASHCAHLLDAGKKDHMDTLMSCRDCAEICSAAARIVAAEGPMTDTICEACASACNECAAACDKLSGDDHMKACAEACRKCEKACKDMLGQSKHVHTAK